MTLSAEDVLAEATAWIWVPEYARTVAADDYLVIAYPEHFSEPTVVTAIDSERAADTVIDDVMRDAATLGRTSVNFFDISDATRPPDLEARLQELGAPRTERLAVLALDLTGGPAGLPALEVPGDVVVRPATTLDDLRAIDLIDTTVFGGSLQSDEALAESLASGGAEGRALAWREGVPIGTAGHVVEQGTLRLWGGAVVPEARHAGAYRALLAHRLRAGVEAGATMALVKGRVETSAPVLLRTGFRQYGEVRAYRLDRG